MSPARQRDTELDSLIEEITVDAYDEDEQLMGFENALQEANLPCPGTVLGEDVQVLSVTIANDRPDLLATCSATASDTRSPARHRHRRDAETHDAKRTRNRRLVQLHM